MWMSVISVHLAGTFKPAKMSINRRAFREEMADLHCRPCVCWGLRGPGGFCFKAVLYHGSFSIGTDERVFFKKKIITFFKKKF